jgi:hypothetical protein
MASEISYVPTNSFNHGLNSGRKPRDRSVSPSGREYSYHPFHQAHFPGYYPPQQPYYDETVDPYYAPPPVYTNRARVSFDEPVFSHSITSPVRQSYTNPTKYDLTGNVADLQDDIIMRNSTDPDFHILSDAFYSPSQRRQHRPSFSMYPSSAPGRLRTNPLATPISSYYDKKMLMDSLDPPMNPLVAHRVTDFPHIHSSKVVPTGEDTTRGTGAFLRPSTSSPSRFLDLQRSISPSAPLAVTSGGTRRKKAAFNSTSSSLNLHPGATWKKLSDTPTKVTAQSLSLSMDIPEGSVNDFADKNSEFWKYRMIRRNINSHL